MTRLAEFISRTRPDFLARSQQESGLTEFPTSARGGCVMEMNEKIDHVVLLMLENRSLDNVLGWLYSYGDKPSQFIGTDQTQHYHGLEEVTGITKGTVGGTGTSVPPQPLRVPGFDPNEQYEHTNQQLFGSPAKPTNTNPAYGTPAAMAGFAYDFTTSSHWNPGNEDPAQHHQILEAYTPDQLPILNGLAQSYAVSDAWFASVPTETTPNRAFSICGTSLGCLDDGEADLDFYPQYNTRTLWEALPDDVTWAIYYHEIWHDDQCYTQYTFPYLNNAKGPGDISSQSLTRPASMRRHVPASFRILPSSNRHGATGMASPMGRASNAPLLAFGPASRATTTTHQPGWGPARLSSMTSTPH